MKKKMPMQMVNKKWMNVGYLRLNITSIADEAFLKRESQKNAVLTYRFFSSVIRN